MRFQSHCSGFSNFSLGRLTVYAGAALLVLHVFATATVAQDAPLQDLGSYVEQAVVDWGVPGLAVVVLKDGEVVFSRGYGFETLGEPSKVSEKTLFAIGSTTKAMTAASIGILVDEGKLRWDDRVTEHLPEFRLRDPYVTREITLRDLLTHRAGLGNADFLWYEQETTIDEILKRIGYAEPSYSFRSGFIYQNIMYAAAGEVIARVSGMPWADFVQTRILDPLGMTGTLPTAEQLDRQPSVASPHYEIDGEVRVIQNASVDVIAAAGSVWSNIDDMSRWIRLLLAGGRAPGGEQLLSPETVNELFTPQAIVGGRGYYPTARLTEPHWNTYGLGWFQSDYRGRVVNFHTGSIDGMVAIVGLIRDENLGVCVLANLDHAELRHALMYRVFDLYGEDPPRDWSAELQELYSDLRAEANARSSRADSTRVLDTTPSLPLDRYAGSYSDSLYGEVRVSLDGPSLRLFYGPGLQGTLSHWNFDTFRVQWDAAWRGQGYVTFTLGRDGTAAALEMDGSRFQRLSPRPAER